SLMAGWWWSAACAVFAPDPGARAAQFDVLARRYRFPVTLEDVKAAMRAGWKMRCQSPQELEDFQAFAHRRQWCVSGRCRGLPAMASRISLLWRRAAKQILRPSPLLGGQDSSLPARYAIRRASAG